MTRSWDVAVRVGKRWKAVLAVSAVVALVQGLVAAPVTALVARAFLSSAGRASIGNFEIARFLLAPTGLLALLVLGTIALAGTYMHLAALLRVLGDPPATATEAIRRLLAGGHRLLRLGALQVGTVLVVGAPLVAATLAVVRQVWSGRDLNGLLVLKPPEFWWGLAAAALPALTLAAVLAWVVLRWLFALPVLLEDPTLRPFAALRRSAELTSGLHRRHLGALALWAAVALVVGTVLPALVAVPGAWLLARVGPNPAAAMTATAVVLVLWWAAALLSTWLSMAFLAALVDRLHREATGRPPATELPSAPERAPRRMRAAIGALAVLAVASVVGGWLLLRTQVLQDRVEITAHRMGATHAPENTVAALRRAIADGADWAELDVQLTADGALVILHDFDLARVGGGPKPVAEATLAEVRALEVGRALGLEPAGERVPTLAEVIEAAGGAIRLNIELKPPTPASAAPLADAVLAAIREAGLVGRCRVCSQSYEAMRRMKEAEPGLTVGYIAGAALGDLARLDVDFLMLSASLATGRLVREAHARGMEVHPWTVNDPDLLAPLLDRGVDNVITDVPAALRARHDALRALSAPERLLLRVRNMLAD